MKTNALLLNGTPLWRIALRLHISQLRAKFTSSVIFHRMMRTARQEIYEAAVDDVCTLVRQGIKDGVPVVTMIVGGTESPSFRAVMKVAQEFFRQHPEFGVK